MIRGPATDGASGAAGVSGRTIADGDLVVVYERFDSMRAVYVKAGGWYNSRYGNFQMKDWVGKPYGTNAHSREGGWVYLLAPTPELWTQVLRHRTQILYAADISMVCTFLELRPGCTVLESGTGSGSLTTSLARCVAPTGAVHTFEFHEQRALAAREDFEKNGIGHLVTVVHRNTEENGFPAALHGRADAVFLDLPGPHKVVPSAAACLRPDGVFCAFSPCIEQVQRTCEALVAAGFVELRSMECLLRGYEVTAQRLQPPALQHSDADAGASGGRKRKLGERGSGTGGAATGDGDAAPAAEGSGDAAGGQEAAPPHGSDGAEPAASGADGPAAARAPAAAPAPARAERERMVVCRPVMDAKGHTGYLTFARLGVPVDERQRDSAAGAAGGGSDAGAAGKK